MPPCLYSARGEHGPALDATAGACGSGAPRFAHSPVAGAGHRGASSSGHPVGAFRVGSARLERRLWVARAAQHEVAVTLSRWIAIAALACLLVAVAYLPPQPSAFEYNLPSAASPEDARLNLINHARQRTEERCSRWQVVFKLSRASSGD